MDIRLINLSSYVRPKVVENKQKNWVLNGKNNYFYQYIIDRNNGSPTNASINKSYSDLIYGRGLYAKNVLTNTSDWAFLMSVLDENELKKVVSDFQIFGEASVQVIKTRGNKKKIAEISHIEKNLLVPSLVNEDGEIESYWYSADWTSIIKNPPQEFPVFGTSNEAIEVYVIKPYQAGRKYFADPDYISGIQYCEMEEEIANLNINSIKNGLSAGYIINVPDGHSWSPEVQDEFEKKIKQKLTGSPNASQFVISFNGRDVEITVTPFPVNDNIHKQWQFLTEEAKQQILTAHRATSPSIVGIISSSGFSNTADEMDTAEAQLMKRVIQPKQGYILKALNDILASQNIYLDLYFKPLTEQTSVQMSTELTHEEIQLGKVLDSYAQDAPEGYDLHSVEYDLKASAIANSEQDSDLWKIRYAYNVGTSKTPKGGSRFFCKKMMALSLAGKVFRKEDIDKMSDDGVNGQFAHSGGKYDIFLYAGGVNCHHRWERRIFKKRRDSDGNPLGGNAMQNTFPVNVNEAKRQGAKIPKNDPDVAKAEIDKPNKGRYNG